MKEEDKKRLEEFKLRGTLTQVEALDYHKLLGEEEKELKKPEVKVVEKPEVLHIESGYIPEKKWGKLKK